jgi:sugar O-acyltransferase (sialic acid O-acetyltransferase NeuD family)
MHQAIKRCLILGTGGHCRSLLSIVQETLDVQYCVEGIIDTQPFREGELILGVPVIGSTDDLQSYFKEGISNLFIALGDNSQRKHFYDLVKQIGFNLPNIVAADAYVSASSVMGDANLVCHRVHVGPMARIGNGNILNSSAILEHESSVGDFCHLAPASTVSGRSHIGNLVFLGVNATVIDKISVCDGVVVGAGAVVVKDISCQDTTYVGVPARKVQLR